MAVRMKYKSLALAAIMLWILYFIHSLVLISPCCQSELERKAKTLLNSLPQNKVPTLEEFNQSSTKLCSRYDYEVQFIKHAAEVDVFENLHKQYEETEEANKTLSLITHLTMSRFEMLKKMVANWKGGISAVIYINVDDYQIYKEVLTNWLKTTQRTNIIVHFMFQKGVFYPVNRLRNVAQDNCGAKFVIMVDVDFLPSKNLYNTLMSLIEQGYFDTSEKRAAVIPAFEMNNDSFEIPQTREEVKTMYKNGELVPFHYLQYAPGHLPTNSERWMTADESYQVEHAKEYEPYVLLKRRDSPMYDEHFLHRFSNKAVHIDELHKRGFRFWVIPKVFLVHIPHPSLHMKNMKMRKCVQKYLPSKLRKLGKM